MKFSVKALRLLTWLLHVFMGLLAVFSLFSWRYNLWIDLRWVGTIPSAIIQIAWSLSILLAQLYAGPTLRGLKRPTWHNRPLSPHKARLALLPTLLMLTLLLVDILRFYIMQFRGTRYYHPPITMSGVLLPIFILWLATTYYWLRIGPRQPPTAPITRTRQLAAYAACILLTLFTATFFLLYTAASLPTQPVDLAVVLGMYEKDGRPEPILRDRTLAAIDLYKRGLAKHILLSGAKRNDIDIPNYDEPAAMKWLCLKEGVPEDALTLDPVGFNTRATATNTKRLMAERHYKTVAAVSTESHLPRIWLSFHAVGLDPYLVPSVQGQWITPEPKSFLYETSGLMVYSFNPRYRPAKGEEMKLASPRVVVTKHTGTLELYDGSALIKSYPCITGKNNGDKEAEGDRRTPVGSFHVVFRNPESKFHLSLGLDYPNREDADRGLAKHLITQEQYDAILQALNSDLTLEENQKKLWYTPLGGEIFIHGHAEGRTGTAGCIALTNTDIDELYAILPLGTPVEIRE